jgi:hypothetical protein
MRHAVDAATLPCLIVDHGRFFAIWHALLIAESSATAPVHRSMLTSVFRDMLITCQAMSLSAILFFDAAHVTALPRMPFTRSVRASAHHIPYGDISAR